MGKVEAFLSNLDLDWDHEAQQCNYSEIDKDHGTKI